MKKLYSSTVAISSSLLVVLAVAGVEACLNANASAQARMTDRDFEGLKGQVKEIRVETAKLSNKSGQAVEKNRSLFQITAYDLRGNLTGETGFSSTTNNAITVYSYDQNGNRKGEVRANSKSFGPALVNMTYNILSMFKYDERGKRAEETLYLEENIVSRKIYSYDGNGRKIQVERYEGKKLTSRIVYTHEEQGNVSELTEYKSNGSVARKESYSYEFDSVGNWIKRVTSTWITKDGNSLFEPSEVTYRKIAYY